MNYWDIMSYAAWVISGLILLWLIIDFVRVNRDYDEEFLVSSREAYDELIEYEEFKGAGGAK